jgi:hypothetical protein
MSDSVVGRASRAARQPSAGRVPDDGTLVALGLLDDLEDRTSWTSASTLGIALGQCGSLTNPPLPGLDTMRTTKVIDDRTIEKRIDSWLEGITIRCPEPWIFRLRRLPHRKAVNHWTGHEWQPKYPEVSNARNPDRRPMRVEFCGHSVELTARFGSGDHEIVFDAKDCEEYIWPHVRDRFPVTLRVTVLQERPDQAAVDKWEAHWGEGRFDEFYRVWEAHPEARR